MVFDDNVFYCYLDLQKLLEFIEDEKLEVIVKERGFSYVCMDGEIGCMVNGVGLVMIIMDMIKFYGGNLVNFFDIGGSLNFVKVIEVMRLLLDDKKVKVVFINIFGGII